MGRTACTEPQCLYSRSIPLLPLWAVRPVQSLSACTLELYLYSPYGPYGLYRASVPVQGCTLPLPGAVTVSWYSSLWWALLEWLLEETVYMFGRKPIPLLHFGPKVAHWLPFDWTWATAVKSRVWLPGLWHGLEKTLREMHWNWVSWVGIVTSLYVNDQGAWV
jgi:hypothetical protein